MEEDSDALMDVIVPETEKAEDKKGEAADLYDILRKFSSGCEQNNAKTQIKKLRSSYKSLRNNGVLKSLDKENPFSAPESKERFKRSVIDSLLTDYYNEFQEDKDESFFLAAAKFDIKKLEEIILELNQEDINHMRQSDSVIVFVLKYGDISNDNFLQCIEILIDAGVDINKFDSIGKYAIDYVAFLYESYKNDAKIAENLKKVGRLLVDKRICKSDNNRTKDFLEKELEIDLSNYSYQIMENQTKLFFWILKNKPEEFVKFTNLKKIDVDCDNGENTLLQAACKRSDNMFPVVQFLLKNKADPNKVTKWNSFTPLEIAGKQNYQKSFEELLKHKKTVVGQNQYNNFVRWRSQPMKTKLFELLLESDKLDPSFTFDKTGNTPLHYAITFSHKKAISNLLKRKSSLVVKNKFDKRAVDIIDPQDLESFFDTCLALDNYTPYFTDVNYKMKFRFNCLVDEINYREMSIVSKIGKKANLKHLLSHPFVHTFITLKWFKTKFYFKLCLLFQAVIFLLLSVFFYRLPSASRLETPFCILFSLINIAIKLYIFANFKIINHYPKFFVIEHATLHASTELLLIVTILGSFFQNQFRAFIFIEMAIAFLLTAGYHPKLSKWSLMLQRVFQTFTILLLFFSLIVVAFSVGFHILFVKSDGTLFSEMLTTIYKTYIMTTGEFELDDLDYSAGIAAYLIFLVFAMSVSLVIVNFWTGVAVTDIERIEKDSEINAFKNVIIFITFIDHIYSLQRLRKLRKYLPKPLLFLAIDSNNDIYHDVNKCEVDFYVNKNRQFENTKDFPLKIDSDCFNKIRLHYYKLIEVTKEQQILLKLDELSKTLNELLKASKSPKSAQNESGSSDVQQTKSYPKKKAGKKN